MSTFPINCTDSCQNLLIEGGSSPSGYGRLASGILDDIFNQHLHLGNFQDSDSASEFVGVSQKSASSTKSTVDQRLEYWKHTLRQRRMLQKRLRRATGKEPEQMLSNHPTCIDHRDRETIKRILDQARSRDPTQNKATPPLAALHPYAALLAPQRDFVEIIGIPGQIASELLGADDSKNFPRSNWMSSQLLADRIEEEFPNIQRVLEFYPSIKNLEIVRKRRLGSSPVDHESLGAITDSSVIFKSDLNLAETTVLTKLNTGCKCQHGCTGVCILINGMHYKPHVPEFSPILERTFCCYPYKHHLRTVMRIENSGTEVIRFTWMRVSSFAYNDTLFDAKDNEFIFDDSAFLLKPGEIHDVSVMFKPRMVAIVKQRWLLAMCPRFFFFRPCALTLNLHGRCSPSKEYLDLLENQIVISKRSSASFLLHLALPLDQEPYHLVCPYDRQLEDREAFNRRNKIFHCSTISDAQQLKEFFRVNMPLRCYPRWDYSVRMLIDLVCDHEDPQKRLLLFGELTKILSRVRGNGYPMCKPQELSNTKQIYVRGVIASRVDEWQEKVWQLEKQLLKATQQRLQNHNASQKQDNELIFESKINMVLSKEADNIILREPLTRLLSRRLRKMKHFRDSVYIFSYDLLCNAAEDIVSVIESTFQTYGRHNIRVT
ncbi:uncharacterized protein LOC117894337 [Drosophila subobscura]|uniref:uncharacterized protein LOC117894337 n=1 Tax=Drosophila subobscura TaxID=7241 RepID=UPI00155AB07C|nr:uncharacterized protein LOC117894337 [Drosophila subobscura]